MNSLRLIWMTAALSLWTGGSCCLGANAPVIPDGEYRDEGGVVVVVIQGKSAVLETSLTGGVMKVAGPAVVLPDGHFYIGNMASNPHFLLFGRWNWTWEKDHFVVKERDAPARTLELRRK